MAKPDTRSPPPAGAIVRVSCDAVGGDAVECEILDTAGDGHVSVRIVATGARAVVPFDALAGMPPNLVEFLDGDARVAELNQTHFLCIDAGEASVWRLAPEPRVVDGVALSADTLERISVRAFRARYANEYVWCEHPRLGKEGKWLPLAKWWLEHARRNTFDRFDFDPSGEPTDLTDAGESTFNRFRGWHVTPAPGACERILAHVHNVMAAGSDAAATYILCWLARLLRYPARPGETALVFRGKEGVGKGIFLDCLVAMLAPHSATIHDAAHLTGLFDGHLRDVVLLFIDEALWAGDKQHESALKGKITGQTRMSRAMYADATQVRNHLHLVLATNSKWAVPAGPESRRYAVFDVDEYFRGDRDYFRQLAGEIEAGGCEAFMQYLLDLDLAGFEVRDIPDTEALHEQRMLSWSPLMGWAVTVATLGTLVYPQHPGGKPRALTWWHTWAELYASYRTYCKDNHTRAEHIRAFTHELVAAGLGARHRPQPGPDDQPRRRGLKVCEPDASATDAELSERAQQCLRVALVAHLGLDPFRDDEPKA